MLLQGRVWPRRLLQRWDNGGPGGIRTPLLLCVGITVPAASVAIPTALGARGEKRDDRREHHHVSKAGITIAFLLTDSAPPWTDQVRQTGLQELARHRGQDQQKELPLQTGRLLLAGRNPEAVQLPGRRDQCLGDLQCEPDARGDCMAVLQGGRGGDGELERWRDERGEVRERSEELAWDEETRMKRGDGEAAGGGERVLCQPLALAGTDGCLRSDYPP